MVSRNLPFEYFVLDRPRHEGAVVGYLAGRPIRDVVIDANGHRYRFAGLARRDVNGRLDVGCLQAGEWIVLPGLVYHADADLAAKPTSKPTAGQEDQHVAFTTDVRRAS